MGVAIACETAGGTGVGPAVIRYCFTYGFGVMGYLRVERCWFRLPGETSSFVAARLRRRYGRSPSATLLKLRLDPVHMRAQLLALALDLVVLALLAHAQEVLLAG